MLDTVLADIAACRACAPYLPHLPRPVVRVRRETRILICGQAPGRLVHETDLPFNDPDSPLGATTYGDVFLENERQQSQANFHGYDVAVLKGQFEDMERQVPLMLARDYKGKSLVLPAYDMVLKASHLFNLMNARGAIAVAERASYIGRIRDLCKMCASEWVKQQEAA